jgi:hypothetical protein
VVSGLDLLQFEDSSGPKILFGRLLDREIICVLLLEEEEEEEEEDEEKEKEKDEVWGGKEKEKDEPHT